MSKKSNRSSPELMQAFETNQGTGRARPSVVFDQRANRRDDSRSEVSGSEAVREQPNGTKERLKGGTDETTRPDQSAVRPSPRGGEKANYGPKYSLREDVRSYRGRDEVQPGTHTRKSLGDGGSIRVLGAKLRAPLTQNSVHPHPWNFREWQQCQITRKLTFLKPARGWTEPAPV